MALLVTQTPFDRNVRFFGGNVSLFCAMNHLVRNVTYSWGLDVVAMRRFLSHSSTQQHCNKLQRIAAHHSTLEQATTNCNTPQHTAAHYDILQRTSDYTANSHKLAGPE